MSNEEFSNEFDALLNSYNPGFVTINEYEKSLFLTEAQESIILQLYNGKNTLGDSFEKTEEIRRYLSNLVSTAEVVDKLTDIVGISSNSTFFTLPDDVWFIVQESVDLVKTDCYEPIYVSVVPITHDEYHRIKNNPFRHSTKKRVLRLDISDNIVELISKFDIVKYRIRYIKKLQPIILVDLDETNLSIDGITSYTPCQVHESLHRSILEKAVALAIATKAAKTDK